MMQPFKTVLVPTDFSTAFRPAMETAQMLAERFGASVHLLHVLQDPYVAAAWSEGYTASPDLLERFRVDAERGLKEMAALAPGLNISTEVAVGSPAQTIVDIARARNADVIVMGTHGRTGFSHLLLGSVAERVVRLAACAVLTVRERSAEEPVAVNVANQAEPLSA